MDRNSSGYQRLYEKHADLVELIRTDLERGNFVYRFGRGNEHARTTHMRRSLEDMVDRVFAEGSPGSTFEGNGDMCDALSCLIFHEDEPCAEFLNGLDLGDGGRFELHATSPRIQGTCVKLDHGILRAGVTHSAKAVFAIDEHRKNRYYGALKLVTCFPDADKMEPADLGDLKKIVHDCPAYRRGTGVTRIWADLSVDPTSRQLSTYHVPARYGAPERLEINLLDHRVVHHVEVTEDSMMWQICQRRGDRAGRAIDRPHVLNDPEEMDRLTCGPYAGLIGELCDRCAEHVHISHPEYADDDFSDLRQSRFLEQQQLR